MSEGIKKGNKEISNNTISLSKFKNDKEIAYEYFRKLSECGCNPPEYRTFDPNVLIKQTYEFTANRLFNSLASIFLSNIINGKIPMYGRKCEDKDHNDFFGIIGIFQTLCNYVDNNLAMINIPDDCFNRDIVFCSLGRLVVYNKKYNLIKQDEIIGLILNCVNNEYKYILGVFLRSFNEDDVNNNLD